MLDAKLAKRMDYFIFYFCFAIRRKACLLVTYAYKGMTSCSSVQQQQHQHQHQHQHQQQQHQHQQQETKNQNAVCQKCD